MPLYTGIVKFEASALSAAASYSAWATELGVSPTATLVTIDGDYTNIPFLLASPAVNAGAVNAEWSCDGQIGWSGATKIGAGDTVTDYESWAYWAGGVMPDVFLGFRIKGRNCGTSGGKVQKASGWTIITGRVYDWAIPATYVEFAVRFSPDLAVIPEIIVTTSTTLSSVSFGRFDPSHPSHKFVSNFAPGPGDYKATLTYTTGAILLPPPLISKQLGGGGGAGKLSTVVYDMDLLISRPLQGSANLGAGLWAIRAGDILSRDVYFGGTAKVEGVVTVDGVLASRRVTIYDRRTKAPIDTMMSKPDGSYSFSDLDGTRKYYVLGEDYEEARESVIRDRIVFPATTVRAKPAFIYGTMPMIVVGEGFSFTPMLTVDMGAVVWTIDAGSLPDGFVIDAVTGRISGATTATFSPPFVVRADWDDSHALATYAPVTVVSGDSSFDKVVLLLSMNGADASTSFIDNSIVGSSVTSVNGARLSTASSRYGGSAALFDGVDDYLTIPYSSAFAFAALDFTIEFWAFQATLTAGRVFSDGEWGGNYWPMLEISVSAGVFAITINHVNSSTHVSLSASITVAAATWNHVAFVRAGNTITVYINGQPAGSMVWANSVATTGLPVIIGAYALYASYGGYYSGYLDDFRVTKGLARYTSAFSTPPPAPTYGVDPHLNSVVLHLAGDVLIRDSSQSAKTITVGGAAATSTAQKKYGVSSIYFNGANGTDLTLETSTDFDLGDTYTVESWVYVNSLTNGGGIVQVGQYSAGQWTGFAFSQRIFNDGGIRIYFYGGVYPDEQVVDVAGAIAVGAWYHIAQVREGTVGSVFINGVLRGSIAGLTRVPAASTQKMWIGHWRYADNDFMFLDGYIDDLRITKGVARYTAAFTPPASALPVKRAVGWEYPVFGPSTSWTTLAGSPTTTYSSADRSITMTGGVGQNMIAFGPALPQFSGWFEIEADLVFLSDSAGRKHFGLFLSNSRTALTGFRVLVIDNGGGIDKYNGGSWAGGASTQVPDQPCPPVFIGGAYTFKVTRTAAFEWSYYINGIRIATYIDDSFDNLYPGLFVYGAGIRCAALRYIQH